MQTASSSVDTAPKAGWWVRFFAYFVDSLIVAVPAAILGAIVAALSGGFTTTTSNGTATANGAAFAIFYLLILVGPAVYFIYFWTQQDGQTIMNKAMSIKVVKTDGSPITIGGGVARYIGYILNSIIFGLPIGWVWAAFDANKQGWHDKIAGTYVVKTS